MSGLRGVLTDPLLSVVMPAYNAEATIEKIVDGRGREEGTKITWRDGVVVPWVLLKYRFTE